MNPKFNENPACEECKKKIATCFVFKDKYVKENEYRMKCYFFCDKCQNESNPYWIGFDDFFNDTASIIDWLAHMEEKTWFDEKDFFEMMRRFRKATDSYGGLIKKKVKVSSK